MICTIRNNTITLDDAVLFAAPESSFADFAKKALKALNVEYPKFFKMDNLSKLAFLAAEAVLSPLSAEAKSGTALLFANRAASLDTDLKHQATIANPQEYYPSPAVFVYTLPNICLAKSVYATNCILREVSLYSTAISRRLRSCKPIAKLFWIKV